MEAVHSRPFLRFLIRGAAWGVVASLAMAMYAMVASAVLGQGLLTPLYGIASPLVGDKDMMASMQGIHINVGPMVLGAVVHMMWGALYGVIFALLARQVGLTGLAGLLAGIAYGLVVMVFMSLVVLPLVGAGSMPKLVGISFGIEHAIYGLVLGLWPLLRPSEFRRDQVSMGAAT